MNTSAMLGASPALRATTARQQHLRETKPSEFAATLLKIPRSPD
jgi:hypothetical protein